jgi:hypothetical protein
MKTELAEIEWHYLPELPNSDLTLVTAFTSCWGRGTSYYLYVCGNGFPECIYAWAYLPKPPPKKEDKLRLN